MFARLPRRLKEVAPLLLIPLLFLAVYRLPPDTSLESVEASGVLRACVPSSYPPLVTPEGASPGVDIELLEAIAQRLEVRLLINTNTDMGHDFNPRSWRLVRAQCQVIAGGVVDSPMTRSFLDVTPAYLETGWAFLSAGALPPLEARAVGVYTGVTALDRLALSRFLRERGTDIGIIQQPEDIAERLRSGIYSTVATEALLAGQLASENGWTVTRVPGLARFPLVLGRWKGALTLKRRIVAALAELEQDGTLATILRRYDLAPMRATTPH